MATALFEIFIDVDIVSVRVAYLFESVHIELSDEGGKVVMFEVAWQDFFSESWDVFYIEGVSCGSPTHYIDDLLILCDGRCTSTIYSNLAMNMGMGEFLDFLLLLLLIYL